LLVYASGGANSRLGMPIDRPTRRCEFLNTRPLGALALLRGEFYADLHNSLRRPAIRRPVCSAHRCF
jgi:hypothetical protein